MLNTWVPIGKDRSASMKPTYSIASPSSLNVNQLFNGVYGDIHSLTIIKAYMYHLAPSVQQGCHCIAIYCDLFLIGPTNYSGPRVWIEKFCRFASINGIPCHLFTTYIGGFRNGGRMSGCSGAVHAFSPCNSPLPFSMGQLLLRCPISPHCQH